MQLIWIGVQKKSLNKGIGKKLLKWLEKESKRKGLKFIEVETLSDRDKYEPYAKTREFYYKNGFKKSSYRKPKMKGWDEEIILVKELK